MEVLYIETTVVSYLTARPSRDLVLAAHQQITQEWWSTCRQEFLLVTSEETLREAGRGEPAMAALRLQALTGIPMVPISPTIRESARRFIAVGALPSNMESDAIHLAAAAQAGANYLLTWNCRHLANPRILRRLESESRRMGWTLPLVCTPLELIGG